jgi:hypothetical protein
MPMKRVTFVLTAWVLSKTLFSKISEGISFKNPHDHTFKHKNPQTYLFITCDVRITLRRIRATTVEVEKE